ncbi:MAG: SDR family NAD(P)-dependent oxidoreductase, partial [Actinobacteria bacterium]|nr:SDR family NAD(P)-dependent oxidoreductase [Actinomycetota bacterium]
MDVNGRRVLVTGASRGIGEAIARSFARAGARVALVARSEGPLKELAAETGGTSFPTDLSDTAAVAGLIDRVEADGGPIDILVN